MNRKWVGNCSGLSLLEFAIHSFGNEVFLVANQSVLTNSSDVKMMAEGIELKGAIQKGRQVGRQIGVVNMESVPKLRQQGDENLGHKI
jgi:hypothetical protein